ncbi:protein kinase domain-containing protein [Cellulomonas hominis]
MPPGTEPPTGEPPAAEPRGEPSAAVGEVVLGGRYVLGEVLGSGSSAVVYEAVDPGSPRPLAAKVLHPHLARDPARRALFVAEARAAARVQHPGLVGVLDTGVDDVAGEPVAWIVLVRAPGLPLADVTGPHGLGTAAALTVAVRVLDALAEAHAAGLVHRDVSARNVMVELAPDEGAAGRVGAVTLLDLGLAGPGSDLGLVDDGGPADGSRWAVGTVASMSPEQASGRPVDARTDVYAVGVLLYLMLTGHAPYERSEPAAVLRAHLAAPVPVPSARADVPHVVDRLVVRAMAKSPDRRFGSAAEMRDAALAILAGAPAASGAPGSAHTRTLPSGTAAVPDELRVPSRRAPQVGSPTPPEGAPRRSGARQAAVAGLVVALLGGLVWLAASGGRGSEPAALPTPAPTPVVPEPVSTVAAPLLPPEAVEPVAGPTTQVSVGVAVPDLTSLDLDGARAALAQAGLVLGTVATTDSPAPEGRVLASDPAPTAWVDIGTTVDVTAASGWSTVPPVTGETSARALELLGAAGLAGTAVTTPRPQVEPGLVVRAAPAGGTRVRVGSTVLVLVATAPAGVAPTASPAPSGGPTGGLG